MSICVLNEVGRVPLQPVDNARNETVLDVSAPGPSGNPIATVCVCEAPLSHKCDVGLD